MTLTPDEARAWDLYVAGALASPHLFPESAPAQADVLIIERRKRAAPAPSLTVEAALRNLVRLLRSYFLGSARERDVVIALKEAESLLQSRDGVGATQEMAPDGTVTK